MNLLTIWLTIVCCVVAVAAVLVPSILATASQNRDKLAALMDAHEQNLRSDDPEVVRQSKERWKNMCQFLRQSRCTSQYGIALEQFGRSREAAIAKERG